MGHQAHSLRQGTYFPEAHAAVFIAVFLPQSLVLHCIYIVGYFVSVQVHMYVQMLECAQVCTGKYMWRSEVDDRCPFC